MDLFSGLSDAFSVTFPRSGMTRSGRLFLHPQSVPPHRRERVFLIAWPARPEGN